MTDEQVAHLITFIIAIIGMAISFIAGYVIGNNDAKKDKP